MTNSNRQRGQTTSLVRCRECDSELPHPIPTRCPYCDRLLEKYTSGYFGSPDYLFYQMEAYKKEFGPVNEKTGMAAAWGAEKFKEYSIRVGALREWCRKCPAEDRLAAVNDALVILQNIIHSELSREQIKVVVETAKKIGPLAEAIENYYKNGGGAQHELQAGLLQAKPTNDLRRQEATS